MAKKGDKCEIKNCNNLVVSRGNNLYRSVCTRHHKKRYSMPYLGKIQRQKNMLDVLYISELPCAKCGWDKSFCDRHRIIRGEDGGKYTKENTIPLCPNCHRLEHINK